MKQENPLILVFYLDRQMMMQAEIINPFVESVNMLIEAKKANIIALFLPSAEGESERVECINPVMVQEADMVKINKMIEDIQTQFSVGVDISVEDKEISLDNLCNCERELGNNCDCKTCDCEANLGGKCEC